MLTWAILFQTLNAYINFILIKNQIPFFIWSCDNLLFLLEYVIFVPAVLTGTFHVGHEAK